MRIVASAVSSTAAVSTRTRRAMAAILRASSTYLVGASSRPLCTRLYRTRNSTSASRAGSERISRLPSSASRCTVT